MIRPARAAALWLIRLYQRRISPAKPPCCRFLPTCSSYALEAIETHGLLRGGFLSLRRLIRCSPLHQGGYDPVPPPRPGRFHPYDKGGTT